MASAVQVAATRVALALREITDAIEIKSIDPSNCKVTTKPKNALGGKFSALNIEDFQMPFFRSKLAEICKEIRADIMNEDELPLPAADMQIQLVVDYVRESLLVAKTKGKWNGQCAAS